MDVENLNSNWNGKPLFYKRLAIEISFAKLSYVFNRNDIAKRRLILNLSIFLQLINGNPLFWKMQLNVNETTNHKWKFPFTALNKQSVKIQNIVYSFLECSGGVIWCQVGMSQWKGPFEFALGKKENIAFFCSMYDDFCVYYFRILVVFLSTLYIYKHSNPLSVEELIILELNIYFNI